MAVPSLTYERYAERHLGRLDREAFEAALPAATARLTGLTGDDVPERHEPRWLDALGVLCDRVAQGRAANVTSERVGETTLSFDAAASGACDYDVVRPYLAPTGLLWQGVR